MSLVYKMNVGQLVSSALAFLSYYSSNDDYFIQYMEMIDLLQQQKNKKAKLESFCSVCHTLQSYYAPPHTMLNWSQ